MEKVRLFFLLWLVSVVGYGQSIDERIANAMNSGAWRELRELYLSEGEGLQTPFLHPLSKFFIHHFYNRPDSALYYGGLLLEHYQEELGGSVPSTIYFMAADYARLGDCGSAADLLHRLNEATRQAGGEVEPAFAGIENQYRAMAERGQFAVERPGHDVEVPMRYYSNDRKDPVMIYLPAELNGVPYEVNFDTGAGVNVMAQEVADSIGAHIAGVEGIAVAGMQTVASRFAIVDSIRLGELVYRNVPFQIIDFATGNEEADAKLKELDYLCVLGSQTMFPLEEVRFDFAGGKVRFPARPSPTPAFAPNWYYSESNMPVLSVLDKRSGEMVEALLDTGAALTKLTSKYYNRNQMYFDGMLPNDSVRMAGAGGVHIAKVIRTPWEYEAGGVAVAEDSVAVDTSGLDWEVGYDCLFGLPSLTLHDVVTINFKDMWVGFLPEK